MDGSNKKEFKILPNHIPLHSDEKIVLFLIFVFLTLFFIMKSSQEFLLKYFDAMSVEWLTLTPFGLMCIFVLIFCILVIRETSKDLHA